MGEVIDIGGGIAIGSDPAKLEILDLAANPVVIEFGVKSILFRGDSYLNVLDIDGFYRTIELRIEPASSWEHCDAYQIRYGSNLAPLVNAVSKHVASVVLDRVQLHLNALASPQPPKQDFDTSHIRSVPKKSRWRNVREASVVAVCVVAIGFIGAVAVHAGWTVGERMLRAAVFGG